MPKCLFGRTTHGHVINHYAKLAFEVDAVSITRQREIFRGPQEVIPRSLIHQRNGLNAIDWV
ncbi:hypothetical protein D3C76_1104860 [compost metagenome]